MGDPLDIGPFRLSDFRIHPVGGSMQLHLNGLDLFSDKPASLSIGSADLKGTIIAESNVRLPLLGLDGAGKYTLDLHRIRINNNRLDARVNGKLTLSAGPLRVDAHVTTEATTRIDDPIVLKNWREHLIQAGERATADFQVNANLGLGPLVGSTALLKGHTSGNSRGNTSFVADLRLGRLRLAEAKGTGSFAPGAFDVTGRFSGGLPPVIYSNGWYNFGLGEGLRIRGVTAGVLIPASTTSARGSTRGNRARGRCRRTRGRWAWSSRGSFSSGCRSSI